MFLRIKKSLLILKLYYTEQSLLYVIQIFDLARIDIKKYIYSWNIPALESIECQLIIFEYSYYHLH